MIRTGSWWRPAPAAEIGAGRRLAWLAGAALGLVCGLAGPAGAGASEAPGARVAFADLPGFGADDPRPALRLFLASCRAPTPAKAALPPPPGLAAICAAARRLPARPTATRVRAFFADHFEPRRVTAPAFFTGYYEPVVRASLRRTPRFATPLLAPPPGVVTVRPGSAPGLDPALTAARRLDDGRLIALPDRAGIETGDLGAQTRPLAFVAQPVDAFFIQVQGSARLILPGGQLRRLVFAGRNGYPYTSIGRLLVTRLGIPPSAMGMKELAAWIESHGQGEGEAGLKLMRENRSYIFFRFDESLPARSGPIGGEGVSLTPQRSLAVDRRLWPYGLPFFVATTLPDGTPYQRLMVAQDTGAAIEGRGRADIFFGTGDAAARLSGPMRQTGTLYVLWPKTGETGRAAP